MYCGLQPLPRFGVFSFGNSKPNPRGFAIQIIHRVHNTVRKTNQLRHESGSQAVMIKKSVPYETRKTLQRIPNHCCVLNL